MYYNPIDPHCGPFNPVSPLPSNNPIDEACRVHDLGYSRLGKRAYVEWNEADDEFLDRMNARPEKRAKLYGLAFKAKRMLLGGGVSRRGRSPSVARRISRPRGRKPVWSLKPFLNKPFRNMRYGRRTYRRAFGKRRRYYRRKTMGRRQSYRRRSYGYRPRYKANRSRSRLSRKVMQIVSRATAPPKVWKSESAAGKAVNIGTTMFWCPASIMSASDWSTAVADTGEGGNSVGLTSTGQQTTHRRSYLLCDIRNLGVHPVDITVYYCVAKGNFDDVTYSTVESTAINSILTGFKSRMLDADETAYLSAVSSDSFESLVHNLSPELSTDFKDRARIYHKISGILEPGSTLKVRMTNFKVRKFLLASMLSADNVAVPGFTKFPIIKVCGALGNLTTDETDVTTMDCNIGVKIRKEISTLFYNPSHPVIATTSSYSALGAYEGPTDDDMKED